MHMKKINHTMKHCLLALSVLALSACNSGGTISDSSTNISGSWVGSTIVSNQVREVTMTLAQADLATRGVTETTVDGNILITGICVFNFSGASLNLDTGNFIIGAGTDFSLISIASSSSITGAFSSLDDDPTDNEGCTTFKADVSFVRAT